MILDDPMIFEYRGAKYPEYLKHGNACQHIAATAKHFCVGVGLDVGAGKWPLPGARPIDATRGGDAMALPEGMFDYVFSSHCIEHVADPIAALEHWITRIRPGGTLFVYAPHPDMRYWRPEWCRKHKSLFYPRDMGDIFRALGLVDVLHSERDMAWSFSVVGFVPK